MIFVYRIEAWLQKEKKCKPSTPPLTNCKEYCDISLITIDHQL